MDKTASKQAYLDGIRGLAALSVFFDHFLLTFYSAYYNFNPNISHLHNAEIRYGKSVFNVFSSGHYAVCIFFVLSGYVLSRKYFLTGKTDILISGAFRRFLRLYIPVASAIIISFVLLSAHLYFNIPASAITQAGPWLSNMWTFPDSFQRLITCLKVGTMFQGDNAFDTSLWTMSIELTGSLLVFAFLALTHHTKRRAISLVILFLFCKVTYNYPMAAFVLGVSLNYVEQIASSEDNLSLNKYRNTLAVTLLIIGLLLGSYPPTFDTSGTIFAFMPQFFTRFSEWFHIFGAYFLIIAFICSPTLQNALSKRLFLFLGYISFCLYLLHPLIIGSFSCYLLLRLYPVLGYNYSVSCIFILTTIVCVCSSWLMAKYIDKPGTAFSKYVYNRWFRSDKKTIVNQE